MHWLQFPDEAALVGHWREQYEDAEWRSEEERGTFAARIGWLRTMRRLYGGMVDEEGRPLPVWRAWQLAGCRARA